mmetsp:Transcript_41109/g.65069  ORF Transcript_41109/g.65069 Transcript_41109/m.65069 type:complete len:83 (+) Transcript_41109:280-528(+)
MYGFDQSREAGGGPMVGLLTNSDGGEAREAGGFLSILSSGGEPDGGEDEGGDACGTTTVAAAFSQLPLVAAGASGASSSESS